MRKISYIIAIPFAMLLAGCTKSVITQYGDAATGALVKIVHTAPGTPAIDVYVNNVKITPVASVSVTDNAMLSSIITGINYNYNGTAATYLGLFPGSNYASVATGSTVIKVQASTPVPALVSPQTSAPGAAIGTITQATTAGAAYSVFTLGLPGSAISPLGIKVIPDVFPAAQAGMAYVRLAYMIPNGAPVDMSSTVTLTGATVATTTTVVTNLAYSNASDFVAVPVNPTGLASYTFQLYLTATTTKLGTVSAAISLAPGRYYTIIGRGLAADYPVPGTTITLKATARPTLPLTDPATKLPEIYFAPPQLVFYTNK
jgi:hypothetical protein